MSVIRWDSIEGLLKIIPKYEGKISQNVEVTRLHVNFPSKTDILKDLDSVSVKNWQYR